MNARSEELDSVLAAYHPFRVVIQSHPDSIHQPPGIALGKPCIDNQITYYLCRNFTCEMPVTDPRKLP
jgi:uncharacterized protein YyaL (SSP411 family)